MATPNIWNDVLEAPAFILNMDRCPDRLELSMKAASAAGFKNIRNDDLVEAWKEHGSPAFDKTDQEFVTYKGKQGCALGHYNIWKKIITENIPFATVFEDDIKFHKDWNRLAPLYFRNTPSDYDILYFGSQIDYMIDGYIVVTPVFCTHAYFITLEGAKRMYEMCLRNPRGTKTIDCMIIDEMKHAFYTGMQYKPPFQWYVWNGTHFPDPYVLTDPDWEKRNAGLVFQDPSLGTFVRPW